MNDLIQYPFEIQPLSEADGGGYQIIFPDFNTCMSDGDTIDEAIKNGREALADTIAAMKGWGMEIPEPNGGGFSGKFMARVPKSVHSRLVARAKREGSSLNALILSYLSEGLARHG